MKNGNYNSSHCGKLNHTKGGAKVPYVPGKPASHKPHQFFKPLPEAPILSAVQRQQELEQLAFNATVIIAAVGQLV